MNKSDLQVSANTSMTNGANNSELADHYAAIVDAHQRIHPFINRTPVLSNDYLDARFAAKLFFKCENLQKIGAFKARGACNAVFSLSAAEAARGVVTHSSGNHGAALAWAAAKRGIPAWVVVPKNAPAIKKAAVAGYGATVRYCEPTLAAREAACSAIESEEGSLLIHPFNDSRVIAGQGTAAIELLQDAGPLDYLLTPVGGGGLLSGSAIVSKHLQPSGKVIGTEPAGADDAARSIKSGHIEPMTDPKTIADGLRTSLGSLTFPLIRRYVDDVVTVEESSIVEAMRLVWDKLKIIIEPSSAVPVAALLEAKVDVKNARVGIIFSGGNVDLDQLPWR